MSWLYTIIFGGLLFSSQSGTVTTPEIGLPGDEPAAVLVGDESEKFEKTYPLNPNGRVSVSNVNGSIVVEAWDRNEVKLEYTKTATTKEQLADVEVRVDSSADRLDVETIYGRWNRDGDRWRSSRVTVEYRLMVPRTAFLNEIETVNGSISVSNFTNFTKLSAVNGEIQAKNLKGVANISTVNGEVAADFDALDKGSKIVLSTVNGRVNLIIPSDSNATINADSLNGSISNDFGLRVRKGKYVGRDLSGRLGSGDVRIKLDSVNGGLSVGRKNDGRTLSPATDLLPLKDKDDEDWNDNDDLDTSQLTPPKAPKAPNADKVAKSQMESDLAIRDSQKQTAKALKQAKKEIEDIQPALDQLTESSVAAAADSAVAAAKIVNSVEVQQRINEALARQRETMSRSASEAFFTTSLPRVKRKSGNFSVKGIPTVTVYAEPASVKVTGWDKNEVAYRVVQLVEPRRSDPLSVVEEHTDSTVKITIDEPKANNGQRYYGDGVTTRVEVFVPRKSNLKITANGELRIEGVTGDVMLNGSDEPINVRDVEGKLRVENSDGLIRVIGFRGEIDAQTSDGDINLEGDFTKLNATASDGSILLTLPENTGADLESSCPDIEGEGIEVTRTEETTAGGRYRIGRGGAKFNVRTEGEVRIRGASSIK